MTYSIRKQDTITPNWGVYYGDTLVEGGFRYRDTAEQFLSTLVHVGWHGCRCRYCEE